VNSVFGVASRGSGSDPYKDKDSRSARGRNTVGRLSYLRYSQEDLESVSDNPREMIDRRQSMPIIGGQQRPVLAVYTFSRPSRGSITIPSTAVGRSPRGVLGRSYSQTAVGVGYPNRPPSRSTICNDPVFYPDQYEEYYEQEGGQVVWGVYPNDLSFKVVSPARVLAPWSITQSFNGKVTQARPSNYSNPISVHPLQPPCRPIHTSNHPRVNVLCIEEGHGGMIDGGGNESDPSMPVPGPSPGRRSRVLLKSVVGNIHHHHTDNNHSAGKDQDHAITETRGEEGHGEMTKGAATTAAAAAAGAAVAVAASSSAGPGTDLWQVHSGSLASFRGLDDPSRPKLRVMNPDDML